MKKLWWKARYAWFMCGCLTFKPDDIKFSWYNAGESWDSLTEHGDDPGSPVSAAKEEISYWT